MSYVPLFDPDNAASVFDGARTYRVGDRAAERYEYDPEITLAINVALAAGRPLLVRGRPGTGKSSLARSVATRLGWRYYEMTVSSRTSARDLLWSFDAVARLADAEAHAVRPAREYVTPGPLWWAFESTSAAAFGHPDPGGATPAQRAVVLVDEIDKADPDVPNDLLVPLGGFRFQPEFGPEVVAAAAPLVILTSNDERDLPLAFLRRCIVLVLAEPDPPRLRRIAQRHFPELAETPVFAAVLAEYERVRDEQESSEHRPSVAELLDALAACDGLRTGPNSPDWPMLAGLVLGKATGALEDR